eukprot:536072_1
MVLRCYYRYMMFMMIQHVCVGIGIDKSRIRVHKAIHHENSWTFPKSTKHIKIINNMSLPLYDDILGQRFGYQFLSWNNDYGLHQNLEKTQKNNKRCSLCSSLSVFNEIVTFFIGKTSIKTIRRILILYDENITISLIVREPPDVVNCDTYLCSIHQNLCL